MLYSQHLLGHGMVAPLSLIVGHRPERSKLGAESTHGDLGRIYIILHKGRVPVVRPKVFFLRAYNM